MTEAQRIKQQIEGGASIVEACENADVDKLVKEGDSLIANIVLRILYNAAELTEKLGIE